MFAQLRLRCRPATLALTALLTACSSPSSDAPDDGDATVDAPTADTDGAGTGDGDDTHTSADTPGDGDPGAHEVSTDTLAWIRVDDGSLVDELGRTWHLRGINARVEGLFDVTFDDGRVPLQPIPSFDADDARQMAALGFNWLRLPVNWSGLEPTEGTLDIAYLERLDEIIDLANDAGLYVLVDVHQDAYSKHFGEDGAPLWAIVPAPTEDQLLEGPLTDLEARRLSPPVLAAFESFFTNEENLQQRFLPMWRALTGRYVSDAGVIGFEPFNEPVLVHFNPDEDLLHDFYRLLIVEMREVNPRHTLWLEPAAKRNFLFESPVPSAPLGDDQIVYAPHLYPNFAGVSRGTTEAWRSWLVDTFDALADEATAWDAQAALAWGEWGMDPRTAEAAAFFPAVQQLCAERNIAQALWLWKENSQDSWGVFDAVDDGSAWAPRPEAVALLEVPYAMAVPGRFVEHTWDAESRTLRVVFDAQGGEAPPLVYAPPSAFDGVPAATLNGAPIALQPEASSQRALVPWPEDAGRHVLVLEPGG